VGIGGIVVRDVVILSHVIVSAGVHGFCSYVGLIKLKTQNYGNTKTQKDTLGRQRDIRRVDGRSTPIYAP
jgi:hypothetical protein